MRQLRWALAAVFFAVASPAAAQQALEVRIVAGHSPAFTWVELLDSFFVPEVERRLAGRATIKWVRGYGGAVAPVGGESAALREGRADIALVSTVFEAAAFPLHQVSYMVPFATGNPALVGRAVLAMQNRFPEMAAAWTKAGLVFLGGGALGSYELFTSFPVNGPEDLKGRRLLAPGPTAAWVEGAGAVSMPGSLATYRETIAAGKADGAVTFVTGAAEANLPAVAGHMTRVGYGAQFGVVLAARQSFLDKTSGVVGEALAAAGAAYGDRLDALEAERERAALAAMRRAGLAVRDVAPEERRRWAAGLPDIAGAWAALLDGSGLPGSEVRDAYMEFLREGGAVPARDWSK